MCSITHKSGVILLGGWLLMTPPGTFRDGNFEPDQNANPQVSLLTWTHSESYDSARECEARKQRAEHDYFKVKNETAKNVLLAMMSGLCIPADHVYPPVPAPK